MVLWASGLLLASSSAGLVRLSSLRRTVSPWFGRVSLHCNLCGNQNNVPPLRESAPPTIAANVEPASANEPPGTDSSPLLSLTVTGCTGSIGLATAGRRAFLSRLANLPGAAPSTPSPQDSRAYWGRSRKYCGSCRCCCTRPCSAACTQFCLLLSQLARHPLKSRVRVHAC
jgi:hypothetical protein